MPAQGLPPPETKAAAFDDLPALRRAADAAPPRRRPQTLLQHLMLREGRLLAPPPGAADRVPALRRAHGSRHPAQAVLLRRLPPRRPARPRQAAEAAIRARGAGARRRLARRQQGGLKKPRPDAGANQGRKENVDRPKPAATSARVSSTGLHVCTGMKPPRTAFILPNAGDGTQISLHETPPQA